MYTISSLNNGVSKTSLSSEGTNQSATVTTSSNTSIVSERDLHQAEIQGEKISLSDEQLIKTIERAIKAVQGPNTALEVSVHKKTNDIIIKVMDRDTGKIIREIPPEKTLDFAAKLMEIAGILIDEKR